MKNMPRKGENIYKRKDGRWEARYIYSFKEDGSPRYRSIYAADYLTVKKKQNDAKRKMDPRLFQSVRMKKNISFYGLLWLERLKPSSKESTYVRYHYLFSHYISPMIGDRLVYTFSNKDCEIFLNRLLVSGKSDGSGLAPKTVTDIRSVVKLILKTAEKEGELSLCNPELCPVKPVKKPLRILSLKEQQALQDYLLGNLTHKNIGTLIALYTGVRLGELCAIQDWAGVYPLFHWSFIPWGFYLVLAVAFGFMLHVRKRNRQKYSEACRPILGKHTDGWAGRIIDLLAVFALLAGTATTFSVATPLMATIISELFHVAVSRTVINIIILLITCAVYTYSLLHGFKGISKLANICIYMFFGLIAFVLLFGGETRYIIETGFSSLGRMIQNFVDLSTFTDPLRTSNFPQNWTIYYWAYWMVWCVAAPFFIGSISRGRTVRQTILGGYIFGVGSTLTSFIVLGNYSMGMQVTGKADFIAQYLESGDLYGMIVSIIKTMPGAPVIMVVVLLTMIAFYATSFDSIALTASCYSYHTLEDGEQPNKGIQLMWCILLILLPIALLFAESSMNNLQSVSIVAAFPIGAVIVMIAVSFMKDAKKYMENLEKLAKEKGEK